MTISETGGRRALRDPASTAQALVVAAPVVILVIGAWLHRWVGDDGFINLRIVRHMQAGHGPVFNAVERVEAGTSPLWLLVLWVSDTVLPVRLEHLAVFVGIVCAAGGLAAIAIAARRLARRAHPDLVAVPLGAVVVAAVAAFWDFSTSGLESGLQFAWLGTSIAALTLSPGRLQQTDRRHYLCALVIGLGVLVRPDLGVFTLAFLGVLLWQRRDRSRRVAMATLASALALPVAYQVFRMGFFAALVPNTALAKSAGSGRPGQGVEYLNDALGTYRLWPVIVVMLALAGLVVARPLARAHDSGAVVLIASWTAAVVHLAYVVWIGGDFMHARLALPGLFVLLGTIALPLRRREIVGWFAAIAFVVWCAGFMRSDARDFSGIVDERWYYADASGHPNPVTTDHYLNSSGLISAVLKGTLAADDALADDASGVLERLDFYKGDPVPPYPRDVYRVQGWVGISGYLFGTDTTVLDSLGLADPIVSRLDVPFRSRPGHEKSSIGWAALRVMPDTELSPTVADDEGSQAPLDRDEATRILQCESVQRLVRDITADLTPGRFAGNMINAWRNTRLSLPYTPTPDTPCP